jgi:hypothetical protein
MPEGNLRSTLRLLSENHVDFILVDQGDRGDAIAQIQKAPIGIGQSGLLNLIGRLPTLPHTRACSTIGAVRLNYRVRDGNGWDPRAKITQSR